jgi:hypothetical protein
MITNNYNIKLQKIERRKDVVSHVRKPATTARKQCEASLGRSSDGLSPNSGYLAITSRGKPI